MFAKKLEDFSYSPSNFLFYCCGFGDKPSGQKPSRRQSYDGGKETDKILDKSKRYSLENGKLPSVIEREPESILVKSASEHSSIKSASDNISIKSSDRTSVKSGRSSSDQNSVKSGRSSSESLKTVKSVHSVRSTGSKKSLKSQVSDKTTLKSDSKQSLSKDTSDQNKPQSESQGLAETPSDEKTADNDSKEGTAYMIGNEDTSSSDSDDEVLQRYQSTVAHGLKHSGSIKSALSKRSAKSAKSSKSTKKQTTARSVTTKGENDAALAEEGQCPAHDIEKAEAEISEDESMEADAEDNTEQDPPSPDGAETAALVPGAVSADSKLSEERVFENKAYEGERLDSKSPSFTSSNPSVSTERLSNDEHLFDVSDLQNEPPLISKCGSLEVTFRYEAKRGKMHIKILKAQEIPAKDRGGANNVQVRAMLLPTKRQKHKTKVKTGDNPEFNEEIAFSKIFPDNVQSMGVRFRLYGVERMRRERMIGECIVGFASLNLDEEQTHWVVLEPRSNLTGDSGFDVGSLSRSDSASSTQSLQHGGMPELLVGLGYNGTTGRLAVEVIKGSNFRNMAMNRAPDTYVKLTLMSPTGQELQRCKTSVRRGQPNPLFKETFMFQVALFQLPEVTLMVSVYNKKNMKKKEMIGWFSLGMNSSGEEEQGHWSDMRESKGGDQVCRWHVLLES